MLAQIEVPMRQGLKRALKRDADPLWQLVADRFAVIVPDLTPAIAVPGPNPDQAAADELGPATHAAMRDYLAAVNQLGDLVGVARELAAVRGERTPLPMSRYADPDELERLAGVNRANACQGGAGYGIAAGSRLGLPHPPSTLRREGSARAR